MLNEQRLKGLDPDRRESQQEIAICVEMQDPLVFSDLQQKHAEIENTPI